MIRSLLAVMLLLAGSSVFAAGEGDDALARWRNVEIRKVTPDLRGHSLHTYFGINPESPDGRSVLLFASSRPDAQVGDLLLVDRAGGETRVLEKSIEVEDGHRQANQQWVCGGEYIVFMSLIDDEWAVVRLDPKSLTKVVLAKGRQLGWGQPHLDVVPLYGAHWDPGEHRDFEMLNVRTGEIRTVLTARQVVKEHAEFVKKRFGDASVISIFFPMLSPDGKRAFFKLSTPKDGEFRSAGASLREGLLVYDVDGTSRGVIERWGHPAWYADSRHIQDQPLVVDSDTMAVRPIPDFPRVRGGHASPSPDGRVIATDIFTEKDDGRDRYWQVGVADAGDGRYQVLMVAPVAGAGTRSWRPAHPHPSFNSKGNRIYFNVPSGEWTVLYVAEIPEPSDGEK